MTMFEKISNFVVETSEQAVKVVEEGTAILMGHDHGNYETSSSTGHISGDSQAANYDTEDYGDFSDLEGLPEDFLNQESPLNGIAENVLGDIMRNQVAPKSAWENIQAFKAAINWTEPFILFLLGFHLIISIAAILSTKRGGLRSRMIVMGIIFITVRLAEKLNDYGANEWERFASQNYFDSRGVFVSLMLSVPLLVVSACMLIAIIREASMLLIEVKKHELRAKAKARKEEKKKMEKKKN